MDQELDSLKIDWDTLPNTLNFETKYDKAEDILFLHSKDDRPAISVDCDGEFWVRIDPHNGEILGIEIEDFKRVFLKKHPELVKKNAAYVRPIFDFIQMEKCAA
jgi:uncharacterized protein YuzE